MLCRRSYDGSNVYALYRRLELSSANRPCSSKLHMLGAYLDREGELIHVGGRLKNSDLSYEARHPIFLPKQSQLTTLLIDFVHRLHCHPEPQTTQNVLHQKYRILSARSVYVNNYTGAFLVFKRSQNP